jgi:hypothetical protein
MTTKPKFLLAGVSLCTLLCFGMLGYDPDEADAMMAPTGTGSSGQQSQSPQSGVKATPQPGVVQAIHVGIMRVEEEARQPVLLFTTDPFCFTIPTSPSGGPQIRCSSGLTMQQYGPYVTIMTLYQAAISQLPADTNMNPTPNMLPDWQAHGLVARPNVNCQGTPQTGVTSCDFTGGITVYTGVPNGNAIANGWTRSSAPIYDSPQ